MKERVNWIDILRGIGIILVIYGHTLGANSYRHLIYAFHMPLFFFISGAVFNSSKYINLLDFLKKNIKSILIPYFAFALIMFFIWIIQLNPTFIFSKKTLIQFLSIFYGNNNNGLLSFAYILWFLPALFITKVIFGFLQNQLNNAKLLSIIILLFALAGYTYSIFFPNLKLPFGTESAITAIVFYGFGYLWINSDYPKKLITNFKYLLLPMFLILLVTMASIDFNLSGHQIDLRLNHLNNLFLFYIAAFSGIFSFVCISIILNKNGLLEYIGKNTLSLFVWHPLVLTYIGVFLNKTILGEFSVLLPFIYTLLSILIIFSLNYLFKKIKLLILNTNLSNLS